jgi:hypothetical protein
MVTRGEFITEFLVRIDYPRERPNKLALMAWVAAEGGPSLDDSWNPKQARFNPLNTTLRMPGSTSFNSVGVQNYVSFDQGLDATVKTLRGKHFGYGMIRRHLRRAHPPWKTLAAVERSNWGTGGLALRILPLVREMYQRYAEKPIGQ